VLEVESLFFVVYTVHCDTIIQKSTNQIHICYNLISQCIFCMSRAFKAHHQEDICNNTGIVYVYMFGIW